MEIKNETLKLETVANMLTLESKNGWYYVVETVWEDYGANMLWDTIVCHIPEQKLKSTTHSESWQILYPREHKMIMECETPYDFADVVRTIQNGRYFQDK